MPYHLCVAELLDPRARALAFLAGGLACDSDNDVRPAYAWGSLNTATACSRCGVIEPGDLLGYHKCAVGDRYEHSLNVGCYVEAGCRALSEPLP